MRLGLQFCGNASALRGRAEQIIDVFVGVRGVVIAITDVAGNEVDGPDWADVVRIREVARRQAKRALDDITVSLGMLSL
jgi:hypothetical protein